MGVKKLDSLPALDENNNSSLAIKSESEWLTSDEAAVFLRISPYNLRNLASAGRVPYYKFGRSNRYLRSELRELLLAHPRGGSRGNQIR